MYKMLNFLVVSMLGLSLTACGETTLAPGAQDASEATLAFAEVRTGPWVAQVVGGVFDTDNDAGLAERDNNVLSFQAKLFSDGSAGGVVTASRRLVHPIDIPGFGRVAGLFNIRVAVECLDVRGGNLAVISGTVTGGEVDLFIFGAPPGTVLPAAGLALTFWVRDNGDGTFSTQGLPLGGVTCAVPNDPEDPLLGPFATPFFPATNGNISIMDRR